MNASEVAGFYEIAPKVNDALAVQDNSFLELMRAAKDKVVDAGDRLAYLAGIKAAPLDEQYRKLDTTNLDTLLESARRAGFNAQIMSI
ncbi:XRE family transcriptional regulator [Pseudomonas sp. DC3000-4b1]|uniref:XRE family transcriptional regulator n=1 Tax=unclassified Pseudomonas TaxID=196821 RepID=UPI003CEDE041